MTQDITSLIEKLEGAEFGSRELDGAVWYAVHEPDVEHGCLHVEQTDQGPMEVLTCELGSKYADCVGNYTTSLDAALALAERTIKVRGPIDISIMGSAVVTILSDDPCANGLGHAFGNTPALALCIAILKARAQSEAR